MPFGRKAASARDPVSSCKLGGAAGRREGSEDPGEFLGPSSELGQAAEAELAQRLRRGQGSASAAALGHAGPVRAAAREASFADAAEGAARVHAALALAQQPALVQLPALVDVHTACARGIELEASRTLAHGATGSGHAAATHAATLVRILL